MPRELLDYSTRVIPATESLHSADSAQAIGEGIHGPLSVELFSPQFQRADPYELALRIRERAEPLMPRNCWAG